MSRAFLGWFLIEAGQFDDARMQIEAGCALADAAKQPYSQVLIHAAKASITCGADIPSAPCPFSN